MKKGTLLSVGFVALALAASHASAQNINTDFTTAQGFVSTSSDPFASGIDAGTQNSLGGSGLATSPGFDGFHNSDVVNATAGTVTGSGYFLYNGSIASIPTGDTVTETLTLQLGTQLNVGIYLRIENENPSR